MRSDPVLLVSGGDMSADITTKGIYLDQLYAYCFQFVWTGTGAAGTITLQGSNDNVQLSQGTDAAAGVVNWTTLSGTIAVSGAGAGYFDSAGTGWRWLRAKFAKSGTSAGSLLVQYNGKG